MTNRITRILPTKSLFVGFATLILALGLSTQHVTQAQAHHRDGRVIAGVIAGVAIGAILAHRHKRKYRRHHRRHRAYYDDYHIRYDRWGNPYRCYRGDCRPRRKHWRKHRRHHW